MTHPADHSSAVELDQPKAVSDAKLFLAELQTAVKELDTTVSYLWKRMEPYCSERGSEAAPPSATQAYKAPFFQEMECEIYSLRRLGQVLNHLLERLAL